MYTNCTEPTGILGLASWTGGAVVAAPKRLLFVDDDPSILDMLERMIAPHAAGWQTFFCLGAEEAMTMVEQVDFDAIVSDARMPGRDGFWLL